MITRLLCCRIIQYNLHVRRESSQDIERSFSELLKNVDVILICLRFEMHLGTRSEIRARDFLMQMDLRREKLRTLPLISSDAWHFEHEITALTDLLLAIQQDFQTKR